MAPLPEKRRAHQERTQGGGSNRKPVKAMPAKRATGKKTSRRESDRSPLNVFSSLARQTKGPVKSAEGTARTQSPSKSCPPGERPAKRQGSRGVEERNWSPLNVFSSLSRRTKGPSGAPKERLERKARQSHARQAGGRKKDRPVGVRDSDWSPLDAFGSLAQQTKAPSRAPEERLEPKARQSHAHQASGHQTGKVAGIQGEGPVTA